MKAYFVLLALTMVSSCGVTVTNKPGKTRDQLPQTCGGDKSTLCIPQADLQIVSLKTFPKKMVVRMIIETEKAVLLDSCHPDGMFRVSAIFPKRIEMNSMHEGLAVSRSTLEIIDRGENCDNDALFFQGEVEPVKLTRPGKLSLYTFNLEN